MSLVPRGVAPLAHELLASFRVLIVNGPRQSGKTTLLQQLQRDIGGTYVTLDDGTLRAAAQADPVAFISDGARPLMIDEIQRGGDDLVLAIKAAVDRSSARGQFVLAGSTRFLSDPSLSESLAGRAGIVDIWPFAAQETMGPDAAFLTIAFSEPERLRTAPPSGYSRADYFDLICAGGYPEPRSMESVRARDQWYRAYVQAVIDTDVREMARVEESSNLAGLLRLAAVSTAGEFSATKVGSDLGLHRVTVERYLNLLDTVFLIRRVPAWSRNLAARSVRRPKLHLTDTGLAAHLIGVDAAGLAARVAPARGPLVETFIVNELAKQATWAPFQARLHHWRVSQGAEVDLVVERANGQVLGIEAKAADTLRPEDFRGLTALRDRLGPDFVHGFVLYTGPRSLSFGDRLTALPISALWDR